MMPRVQRSIYVDEDLWKRLRMLALTHDKSASDVVEDALKVYVDNGSIDGGANIEIAPREEKANE